MEFHTHSTVKAYSEEMQNEPPVHSGPRRRFLINAGADFWLLGGASILLWFTLWISNYFREDSVAIQQRFLQMAIAISFLTLICNHPHFLISYQLSYGRGFKFIQKNWFALIFVPTSMIATFGLAYLNLNSPLNTENDWLVQTNNIFSKIGLDFKIGSVYNIGPEIMGLWVWVMFVTVGWHYAKQVFGCMMVYAFYSDYPLTQWQKRFIKCSVFSVAILQFIAMSRLSDAVPTSWQFGDTTPARFPGVVLSKVGLPLWIEYLSFASVAIFGAAVIFGLVQNYRKYNKKPSPTFLIAWIALFIWWLPAISNMGVGFVVLIPFFHSLQYLPFAYRLQKKEDRSHIRISIQLIVLLIAGFLSFEFIPGFLDQHYFTETTSMPWFFITCFALFINIHHFFIDSVIWKFDQPQVRAQILNWPP